MLYLRIIAEFANSDNTRGQRFHQIYAPAMRWICYNGDGRTNMRRKTDMYEQHRERNLSMVMDFYELTMSNGYFRDGVGGARVAFDVYYRKNPSDYSSMTTDIDLREDGLMAANDYVISMMCRANDDIDKGNNFRADFNSKLQELKLLKYKQAGKYPTTKDINKRSGMNRRRDRMGTSLFNDIVPRG
jgi:hypothetical protein